MFFLNYLFLCSEQIISLTHRKRPAEFKKRMLWWASSLFMMVTSGISGTELTNVTLMQMSSYYSHKISSLAKTVSNSRQSWGDSGSRISMRPSLAWAVLQIVLSLTNYVGSPLPKLFLKQAHVYAIKARYSKNKKLLFSRIRKSYKYEHANLFHLFYLFRTYLVVHKKGSLNKCFWLSVL